MFGFIRKVVRTGVIGVVLVSVVGGAVALIAGPGRAKAVIHQVHQDVKQTIDQAIDDPTALRAQLSELEKDYPKRIAQVRGDLAELNEQIRQLTREQEISERVVAMANRDLEVLEPKLEAAANDVDLSGGARLAAVSFDDQVFSLGRAQAKANQIRHTKVAYANRAADAAHDLTYLTQQAGRLEELLMQLENERAQFQGQIWQVSRQVDSIARNERLIELLEKRNRTFEECSRYEATSFDQLTGKLAEIRSRQEAELDMLSSNRRQMDYEDMARMEAEQQVLQETLSTPEVEYSSDFSAVAGSRQH